MTSLSYDWGMVSLETIIESVQTSGKRYFSGREVEAAAGKTHGAFIQAVDRLKKSGRLIAPRRGFYLIVRPEDRVFGGPEPASWIDALMKYIKVDYRISLLRAAAFHGSSHQAAMAFQVIAPKQIAQIPMGRHRIEFLFQAKRQFEEVNRREWLEQLKTDAGYAQVAGIELTLLDCTRYFHRASGINGVAQIVRDLGDRARVSVLVEAAQYYENSTVRRLGYLLEHFGMEKQARSLLRYGDRAKSFKPLDPTVEPVADELNVPVQRDSKWKLDINIPIEIDS